MKRPTVPRDEQVSIHTRDLRVGDRIVVWYENWHTVKRIDPYRGAYPEWFGSVAMWDGERGEVGMSLPHDDFVRIVNREA